VSGKPGIGGEGCGKTLPPLSAPLSMKNGKRNGVSADFSAAC
jgi:hypothetical protein